MLTTIHDRDEILQIVAPVVIAAAAVTECDVLNHDKCNRRNQPQAGAGDRYICRGRERFLEPGRVEPEEGSIGRHDVDGEIAQHPAAARRVFPHVVLETQSPQRRLHV